MWISKGTTPEGLRKNMSISQSSPVMSITLFYFYQNEDKMQQYNLLSPKGQPSITSKRGKTRSEAYPHCIKMDNFFPSAGTKLTLLIAWQANKSTDDVLRQGIWTLSGKPANWEDSRLISQNKHLIGVWMPVSFKEEGEEIKLKGHLSCEIGGNVFISSFLQPFIGK